MQYNLENERRGELTLLRIVFYTLKKQEKHSRHDITKHWHPFSSRNKIPDAELESTKALFPVQTKDMKRKHVHEIEAS